MTKQELRTTLKQRRAAIPPEQRRQMDAAIVQAIAESAAFRHASALLLYAPTRDEVNLLPLVRLARERGIPVAFPRCDTVSTTMQFYLLEPSARLTAGAYGIPEPPADAPLCVPDAHALCLLPALGFDLSGGRIGYGKGYYDRYLANFAGVRMGACYSALMLKRLPVEPHDLPVSMVATERGLHQCKAPDAPTALAEDEPMGEDGKETATPHADPSTFFAAWTARTRAALRRVFTLREDDVRPLHLPPVLVGITFLLLLLARPILTASADRDNEALLAILMQLLAISAPATVYVILRRDRLRGRLRLNPPRVEHIWFTVCMLAVMIGGGMLLGILTGGIASLEGNFTIYDSFTARMGGGWLETALLLVAYAILPALGEELIFRGILCAEYEGYGVGVSVALSGMFFAMLHFSFALFPTYFLLGALLACAMYTTRSIWTPVLLHFLYNLFCLFGQPYLSAFYNNAASDEIFIFCVVVIALLFAAFAAGEARKIYHRYAKKNLSADYTVPISPKHLPRRILCLSLTPAVGACLLLFLIASIINLF